MSERKIAEYFEKKYNVDLSKIQVSWSWLTYDYDPSRNEITLTRSIAEILTTLMWIASTFLLGFPYNLINMYMSSLSLVSVFSRKCIIAHEYAHAAWHERIKKYKSSAGKRFFPPPPYKMIEAYANLEELKNSYVPKIQKAIRKGLDVLLPINSLLPSHRKYWKFFNLVEKINSGKVELKSLDEVLEKVNKSSLPESRKEVMRKLFSEEYEKGESSDLFGWIRNSPPILPEKWPKIEKLVDSLY